jgi:hypothetical protein
LRWSPAEDDRLHVDGQRLPSSPPRPIDQRWMPLSASPLVTKTSFGPRASILRRALQTPAGTRFVTSP